jgi:hypothetical protein
MVRVGQSALLIFAFASEDPAVYDRWDSLSLGLVEQIEHL